MVISCELCGRDIHGRGLRMTIEGVSMLLCSDCATKFGSGSEENIRESPSVNERPLPMRSSSDVGQVRRVAKPPVSSRTRTSTEPASNVRRSHTARLDSQLLDDMVLVPDYAELIRTARQRLKLPQEVLAQRVGERVSTLQAIETGRLKPTVKTTRGLERELGISLLEPVEASVFTSRSAGSSEGVTLGDVVKIKRKKTRENEPR